MKKRLISALLCLVLLVMTVEPLTVSAAEYYFVPTTGIVSGGIYSFRSNISDNMTLSDKGLRLLRSAPYPDNDGGAATTSTTSYSVGPNNSLKNISENYQFVITETGDTNDGHKGYTIKTLSTGKYLDVKQELQRAEYKANINRVIYSEGSDVPIKYFSTPTQPFVYYSTTARVWYWDGSDFYTLYTTPGIDMFGRASQCSLGPNDPNAEYTYYRISPNNVYGADYAIVWWTSTTLYTGYDKSVLGSYYDNVNSTQGANYKFYLKAMNAGSTAPTVTSSYGTNAAGLIFRNPSYCLSVNTDDSINSFDGTGHYPADKWTSHAFLGAYNESAAMLLFSDNIMDYSPVAEVADLQLYQREEIPDNVCTVSFNANGGSGNMDPIFATKTNSYVVPINRFTPPANSRFLGWSTTSYSDVVYYPGNSIELTANTTLYARWEPIYTISYNSNGGTGYMSPTAVSWNGVYTLPKNTFTPPKGTTFKEWALRRATGTKVAADGKYTFDANTTVYAVWEGIPHEITFNANAGTGIMSSLTAFENEEFTLPENSFTAPVGMRFKEWAIGGATGTKIAAGGKYTFLEDATMYAIWEGIPYAVTFNANSGTGNMAAMTAFGNEEFTTPANGFTPPKGTRLKEWAIGSPDGTKIAANGKYTFNSDSTLYAIWEGIPYNVTFSANGGTGSMSATTALGNEEFTLPANGFTAPAGTRFKEWAIGSPNGTKIAPDGKYTFNANTTVYAVWEGIPHEITFNANGGTGSMSAMTALENAGFAFPSNRFTAPARMQFKEWAIGNPDGTKIAVGGTYKFDTDAVLYAIWEDEPIQYSFTDGNNFIWNASKDGDQKVTCNAILDKLTALLMDGTQIDRNNITLAQGSTILTLKQDYLKTLALGTHTLRLEYTDGYAQMELNIIEDSGDSGPLTGDNQNMFPWLCVMGVSACGLLIGFLKKHKKEHN